MKLLGTRMMLLAANIDASSADVDDVMKKMNSNASAEQKTSFLLEYLKSQREPLLNFGKTILIAIVVFALGRKIIQLMLKLLDRWLEKTKIETGVRKFAISFTKVILNILLIFIIAGILGVGTSSIVAILGSAGLAVGLALQGSLSNFAGGILILLLRPFRVGEYIVAAGVEGTVQSIDIFYTHIVSADNKVIVIPNGTLSNGNIVNTSQEEKRMLVLDFMVGYETDIQKVKDILNALMDEDKKVLSGQHTVVVDKLNPGRVKMQAKAWVKTEDYWSERDLLLQRMKEKLQSENISIM